MEIMLSATFGAKRTALTLTSIMLVLLGAHVLALQINFNESLGWKGALGLEYWQIAIFDLDEEEGFGTWFSAAILLFAALLMIHVSGALRARSDAMWSWWLILGCGFALMSVDEVVGLHELINTLNKDTSWTLGAFYLVVVVGVFFVPFLWRYRWRTTVLFVAGGVSYVGGAVGIEHFSGTDLNSLRYNMLTGLEEGLEMSGVILAIYAVIDFIGRFELDLRS